MKPAWDLLGDTYAASEWVTIIDVDCDPVDADGESLGQKVEACRRFEVEGFPTLKYFKAGDKKGKAYEGARDFDAMRSFVDKTLNIAKCDAIKKTNCGAAELVVIEKNEGRSSAELQTELKAYAEQLKEAKKVKQEALDAAEELFRTEKKMAKKMERTEEALLSFKQTTKEIGKAVAVLKQLKKEVEKGDKGEL